MAQGPYKGTIAGARPQAATKLPERRPRLPPPEPHQAAVGFAAPRSPRRAHLALGVSPDSFHAQGACRAGSRTLVPPPSGGCRGAPWWAALPPPVMAGTGLWRRLIAAGLPTDTSVWSLTRTPTPACGGKDPPHPTKLVGPVCSRQSLTTRSRCSRCAALVCTWLCIAANAPLHRPAIARWTHRRTRLAELSPCCALAQLTICAGT